MKTLLVILLALLLIGCRSQKQLTQSASVAVDSLAAHNSQQLTIAIDSVVRNINLSFDTLDIRIERPSLIAERPEVLQLRAIKGSLKDQRKQQSQQLEIQNQADTTAYHRSSTESRAEHTATTSVYSPPNGSAMFVCALLAIVGGFVFLRRNK